MSVLKSAFWTLAGVLQEAIKKHCHSLVLRQAASLSKSRPQNVSKASVVCYFSSRNSCNIDWAEEPRIFLSVWTLFTLVSAGDWFCKLEGKTPSFSWLRHWQRVTRASVSAWLHHRYVRTSAVWIHSVFFFSHAINISHPRLVQRVIYGNVLTNPVDLSTYCLRISVCTVSLRLALHTFEGTWKLLVHFSKSSFSNLPHSIFFPTFSLKVLQKSEMDPSVERLRKSGAGPKQQERSQGREGR